jgi:hypothetical protein
MNVFRLEQGEHVVIFCRATEWVPPKALDTALETMKSIPVGAHVVIVPHKFTVDLLIVAAKSQVEPGTALGDSGTDGAGA